MTHILFTLDYCLKCTKVKEVVKKRKDVAIVQLPHSLNDWSIEQIDFVDKHNVFEDIKRTAPILVLENGTKLMGPTRIMKWVKESES